MLTDSLICPHVNNWSKTYLFYQFDKILIIITLALFLTHLVSQKKKKATAR